MQARSLLSCLLDMSIFRLIKIAAIVACTATASADPLSDRDREALLEILKELSKQASTHVDAKYRVAMQAYYKGMSSKQSAVNLYLSCQEKVHFTDQKKKQQAFREWKRKNDAQLSADGYRRALMYQLRWLVLSIEAISEKTDKQYLAQSAHKVIDGIVANAEEMKGHQGVLSNDVMSTVFVQAYNIGTVTEPGWPKSPTNFKLVYNNLFLPPFREKKDATSIRQLWDKRIRQELQCMKHWTPKATGGIRKKNETSPAFDKFVKVSLPRMEWDREVDAFKHGDAGGAAKKMIAHLKKHIRHENAKDWAQQFESLLIDREDAKPSETTPETGSAEEAE